MKSVLLFLLFVSTICFVHSSTPRKFTFENKPFQIVYPDPETHSKLIIDEDNLKILNDLADENVVVVGVVGPFHSGKSFLLNQLMDTSSHGGFQIGPTTDPQTKGLWIWGNPLHRKRDEKDLTFLFLDTEGFYASNVSEAYDAKVFAVTTLMSSYLLYNSVKMIDQSSIEYLELLARRTQLFGLRAEMENNKKKQQKEELGASSDKTGGAIGKVTVYDEMLNFPPLLWVVEDFFLDLQGKTCTQWLHSLLKSEKREPVPTGPATSSLSTIFPSMECHTLFLPHTQKDKLRHLDKVESHELTREYLDDLDKLKNKLLDEAYPKKKGTGGALMNGPALSSLLRLLVFYANSGEFPAIPSIWNGFLEIQRQQAVNDSVSLYKDVMNDMLLRAVVPEDLQVGGGEQKAILGPEEFDEFHMKTAKKAEDLLMQLLFGMEDVYTPAITVLNHQLLELYNFYSAENQQRIEKLSKSAYQSSLLRFQNEIKNINLPLSTSDLEKFQQEKSKEAFSTFDSFLSRFSSTNLYKDFHQQLQQSIEGSIARDTLKNTQLIESRLIAAVEAVGRTYKEDTKDVNANRSEIPLSRLELEELHKVAEKNSWNEFDKLAQFASNERSFPIYQARAKETIKSLYEHVKGANHDAVAAYCEKLASHLNSEFRSLIKPLYSQLPMEDRQLERTLNEHYDIVLKTFQSRLSNFTDIEAYKPSEANLKENINKQIRSLKNFNIEQLKAACQEGLDRAAKIVKQHEPEYMLSWSFASYAYDVADKEINKAIQSVGARREVIQNWLENDLQEEMQSVTNKTRYAMIGVLLTLSLAFYFGWSMYRPRPVAIGTKKNL